VKVLFLCTANACRSQMAEGWARHLKGDVIEPYSAGAKRHVISDKATKVMDEVGIDLSDHYSKALDDLGELDPDYVITVCDNAAEVCPVFPGHATVIHHGFDDPPKLAAGETDEQCVLDHYRRVRDEIRVFVQTLPEALKQSAS
jgi:arsenate reductase